MYPVKMMLSRCEIFVTVSYPDLQCYLGSVHKGLTLNEYISTYFNLSDMKIFIAVVLI